MATRTILCHMDPDAQSAHDVWDTLVSMNAAQWEEVMRRPYKRFLLVRDGFYADPHAVRRIGKSLKYHDQADVTGFVSSEVYYPKDTRRRLERILGLSIVRWDTDPDEGNGTFYMAHSAGRFREVPGVHADEPIADVTVVVYLTPDLPADCGTSLWHHKGTGLEDAPLAGDARRLGKPLRALRERLERDSKNRRMWVELDRAGYRYNRLVAYASGMLHSATRHFGGDLEGGRMYQTFRVGVDWDYSRIHT